MTDDAQATEDSQGEDAPAEEAKAEEAKTEEAKTEEAEAAKVEDAPADEAAKPQQDTPESVLDLARGEVDDADLDGLEAAINSIDFATRRATGDVVGRLTTLRDRLSDLIEQISSGVRRPDAEREELSDEALQICQNLVDQGIAAGEKGNLQEARGYLEEAVRLNPDGIDALFNLGVVYGLLAHHNIARAEFYDDYVRDEVFVERAQICYDLVLEQVPDHIPSLNNLATLYSVRDAKDQAIPLLERIIAIEPKTDDEKTLIASARSQLDDLESI